MIHVFNRAISLWVREHCGTGDSLDNMPWVESIFFSIIICWLLWLTDHTRDCALVCLGFFCVDSINASEPPVANVSVTVKGSPTVKEPPVANVPSVTQRSSSSISPPVVVSSPVKVPPVGRVVATPAVTRPTPGVVATRPFPDSTPGMIAPRADVRNTPYPAVVPDRPTLTLVPLAGQRGFTSDCPPSG